eukprot:GSMAST32.ASY1.ANO1.1485.1 assembled CDS
MGIKSLLQVLDSASERRHVSEYVKTKSRPTLAVVDTMCWLHRACYSCATELALGKPTDRFVHYFLRRVKLLRLAGVECVMICDGASLPSKRDTQIERRKLKSEQRLKGIALLEQSKQTNDNTKKKALLKSAYEAFQKSITITPRILKTLFDTLSAHGVRHICTFSS